MDRPARTESGKRTRQRIGTTATLPVTSVAGRTAAAGRTGVRAVPAAP